MARPCLADPRKKRAKQIHPVFCAATRLVGAQRLSEDCRQADGLPRQRRPTEHRRGQARPSTTDVTTSHQAVLCVHHVALFGKPPLEQAVQLVENAPWRKYNALRGIRVLQAYSTAPP